jgi:hypothetical protein
MARVPEALDWLDSVALPQALQSDGHTHSTYIEIGARTSPSTSTVVGRTSSTANTM